MILPIGRCRKLPMSRRPLSSIKTKWQSGENARRGIACGAHPTVTSFSRTLYARNTYAPQHRHAAAAGSPRRLASGEPGPVLLRIVTPVTAAIHLARSGTACSAVPCDRSHRHRRTGAQSVVPRVPIGGMSRNRWHRSEHLLCSYCFHCSMRPAHRKVRVLAAQVREEAVRA